jgi:hypothetical protein
MSFLKITSEEKILLLLSYYTIHLAFSARSLVAIINMKGDGKLGKAQIFNYERNKVLLSLMSSYRIAVIFSTLSKFGFPCTHR